MTGDIGDIGIALGGAAALVTAIGTIGLQLVTIFRQSRQTTAAEKRDAKIDIIQDHVNGLNQKIAAGAFAEGKAVGVDQERAQPMVPAETTHKERAP